MPDLSPQDFQTAAAEVAAWVAAYRAGLPDRPVAPAVTPGAVRAQLGSRLSPLPEHPQPVTELLAVLDEVVTPALLHWQHPGFFGYFPANASLHSLLGELLSGGLGTQGMLWSTSPAATEVEQVLVDKLAAAVGLDPAFTFAGGGGGVIQDSASSAALVALLAALHRANPGWRDEGVTGRERVYLTSETHSSMAKAVRVAGLGTRAIHQIPCTPGSQAMDPAALAAAIRADRAAELVPVLVCATVGTTGTGAIDPVPAITATAQAIGETGRMWVHVDAAWAGVAALCPEHRHLLTGTERADSVCTNPHKWLATTFDTSLMWVRDATTLPAALSINAEYLRNAASDTGAVVDYRNWQIPLGRRFRALKLWAVLAGYGLAGLREHIRRPIAWAGELADWIRQEPGFVLAARPSLGLVCLRLEDPDPALHATAPETAAAAGDARTRAVLAQVNASGVTFVTHTLVEGRYSIRVAIGGLATTRDHVLQLWEQLRKAAATVPNGVPRLPVP